MEIAYSCGFCGTPLDKDLNDVFPVPSGYDPSKYPTSICHSCEADYHNQQEQRMQVTHEMAMDAQDPSLEGTWI